MSLFAIFSRNSETDSRSPERQPLVEEPEPEPESEPQMGQEEQIPKPESRSGDIAAEWVAFVSISVFLVAAWLITLNSGVPAPFIFHPLLQSLGIALFTYGQSTSPAHFHFSPLVGIITLQPTSQPETKAAGLSRHQLAMIAGVVSIILGASAIIYNKALHSAPHFTSWHGVRTLCLHLVTHLFTRYGRGSAFYLSPGCSSSSCSEPLARGSTARYSAEVHGPNPFGNITGFYHFSCINAIIDPD